MMESAGGVTGRILMETLMEETMRGLQPREEAGGENHHA